jgi:hypothetical protein
MLKAEILKKNHIMTSRYQSQDVMLFIDIGQSRQQHFAEF